MIKPLIPLHLKEEGQAFWLSVLRDYQLVESHHLELLKNACQCLDRIGQARRNIEKNGLFPKDRFDQPRENPAAKTERDNRTLFARLVRELNLDTEPPPENRPPKI